MNFICHFVCPLIKLSSNPRDVDFFNNIEVVGELTTILVSNTLRTDLKLSDPQLLINNRTIDMQNYICIESNLLDVSFQKQMLDQIEFVMKSSLFGHSALSNCDSLHLYIINHGILIYYSNKYLTDKTYSLRYQMILSKDILRFSATDGNWQHDPEKEIESSLNNLVLPREFTLEYLKDLITCRDIIE